MTQLVELQKNSISGEEYTTKIKTIFLGAHQKIGVSFSCYYIILNGKGAFVFENEKKKKQNEFY